MKIRSSILTLLVLLSSLTFSYAQSFHFDPGHTFITFSVNRFGAVDVVGRFNEFEGSLSYDPETQMIDSADFTIEVKSIDTGFETRDEHLRGAVWLDADNHPQIRFSTTSIVRRPDGFLATANLNIHGITKEVEIPFQMTGPAPDPTRQTTIGIAAVITINRQDYGISFSRLMDNGALFIGNEVKIEINALAQMVVEK